jgi:ArsR family transcriptional regulator
MIEVMMPGRSPQAQREAATLLAVAAEPTRWLILDVLATHGTRCVCDIEPVAGVAPNVLSYHLKTLREAGLITAERRGKWIDYTLAADARARLEAALPS